MAFQKSNKPSSYDPNLDVAIFTKEVEVGDSKIILSVHSYNQGEKKLQLGRANKSKEDGSWQFAKLGRMKKEEVKAFVSVIQEVYKNL